MVLDVGISDMLSITQTVGIIGTLLIALFLGEIRDHRFDTIVFDNPNISSAAANQLAAVANRQSSSPFTVSNSTLVYIEYAVIFGIPAAVAATVVIAYRHR